MSIFDMICKTSRNTRSGAIDYGSNKKDGSHDHRFNTGRDRTPAQKTGDKKPGKIR